MNKHNCTIIIDTNQFMGDYMLAGMRWKQLNEYVKATDASLQMPSIVWHELKRNYTKDVECLAAQASSSVEKLNHHLGFHAPHFHYFGTTYRVISEGSNLPPVAIADRYLSYLKARLGLQSKDFLTWEKDWLDEIVDRAIKHVKPFGQESDKGFKDTVLWKTILSLAQRPGFRDGPVVLISANSRDFGNPARKGDLHPDLTSEARSIGLNLHYFESLDLFLQAWASEVLKVDTRALRQTVSDVMLKEALRGHVSVYLKRNENVADNIFLTGKNFKIETVSPGNSVIRVSMSGYLTNNLAGTEYMDFNAEGIYTSQHDAVCIQSFNLLNDPTSVSRGEFAIPPEFCV